MRLGTHILLVAFILIVAWGLREAYLSGQDAGTPRIAAFAAPVDTPIPTEAPVDLPDYQPEIMPISADGIPRSAYMHTDVPSRPRMAVEKYIVQPGDTLFALPKSLV